MRSKLFIIVACIFAVSFMHVSSYADGENRYYEVSVTNMTRGQSFTPIIVLTHKSGVKLFTPGSPASEALSALAEDGDTEPLEMMMSMNPRVGHIMTSNGLLDPGKTTTVKIPRSRRFHHISLAAMLIPTNDAFFALNGVYAPIGRRTVMYLSPAYDAGSEPNDELCANIPGPVCGGDGLSEGEGGEGYVHIHGGIHGIGNLISSEYDWRNPVARVIIKRGDAD